MRNIRRDKVVAQGQAVPRVVPSRHSGFAPEPASIWPFDRTRNHSQVGPGAL